MKLFKSRFLALFFAFALLAPPAFAGIPIATVQKISPYFDGAAAASDYTLRCADYAVGANTSSGNVTITVPSASTVARYPRHWFVKKMTADTNSLYVILETAADSMYGDQFSTMAIERQGQGVEIILNANGKYTFSDWSGIENPVAHPELTTQTPSLSGTTLTMNGTIESLGAFSTVDAYFSHRDVTDDGSWIDTTSVGKTATGAYSATAEVTAGHVFEVQAVLDDSIDTHYGGVLRTSVDYYADTSDASSDGLERYWSMQESAGTDTAASEIMASDTMTTYNGVTISSDTINSQTIYKRVMGTRDYGQSGYAPNWTYSGGSKTILIQVDMNSNSGVHTILSFGKDILSVASNGSGIELAVNGNVSTWASATPFSGIMNMFITVDRDSWLTTLYTVTSSTVTNRTSQWRIPSNQAAFTRLGRGTRGDGNHRGNKYMDDGEVRSLATWGRVLTDAEMKAFAGILDDDGGLIVQ